MRSGITLCSWNSPAPLAENVGFYLSRSVSPVDYRICGLMQERVYIVQTPVCDTSRCDQRLEAAPHWHMGKHITKRHWQSGCVQAWGKRPSLWTSAELKPALFKAKTLHNRFFSEPATVYRGKHVVSRHFHRSCLKANKEVKVKVQEKLNTRIIFESVLMLMTENGPWLSKLHLAKVGAFFETQCKSAMIVKLFHQNRQVATPCSGARGEVWCAC